MVGWHHRLNGPEFEQTLGDGERQGSLVCCSPWGCKEPDTTEQLNNSNIHRNLATGVVGHMPILGGNWLRSQERQIVIECGWGEFPKVLPGNVL